MTSFPEQLSAARKAQLEAHLELLRSLSTQAISSAEQVISLNLSTTRASVEQSSAAVKQLLAVRDPRDFLAFGTQTQQQFQHMMDYGRNLFSIAAGAQLDLQKAMPKLAAVQPAAAPAPSAQAAAPSPASVAPVPATSAAPAPAPAPEPAAAPAPTPAAAAAPAPAPAPEPAAAAQPQPAGADDTTDALNAIAETAHSARPKKVVVVQEDQPTLDLGAKEKPIASAVGQMAAEPAAAEHPLASLPGNSGKIEIPKIAPVEASPPPAPVSGTPIIETKQTEQRAPKGSRKK
jgi:phasin family protein